MPDFLSFINEILWGSVMIYLLLGAGVWFTWRTKYIQFRYIRQFSKSLKKSLQPQPGGLTSFQALCMSLAARVGSGNMAGVALAIAAGGPGAVFGCGSRRCSAWPAASPNALWRSFIKSATLADTFAAVRLVYGPGAWHALDGRAVLYSSPAGLRCYF